MNEAGFFRNIIKKKLLYDCMVSRLESDTSIGIPDTYYMRENHSGWIEMKAVKRPSEIQSKIRTAQWNWWMTYLRHGGSNLYLAALYGKEGRFKLYSIDRWDACRDRNLSQMGMEFDFSSYSEEDIEYARAFLDL